MTEDERKLYIQTLLEVQKQNQDISKTVLTLLIPLVAAFATVTSTIFLVAEGKMTPFSIVNVPYIITILLAFQIFMLWDSQWRAGYQKYVEEKINAAFGVGVVEWERHNDISQRKWSVPNFGTNAIMTILWVVTLNAGAHAIPHGFGRFLHIVGYSLSVVLLILGYHAVLSARDRGYNYSKHGLDANDAKIGARAFQIWEAEGFPNGKEAEHWERAKRELISSKKSIFGISIPSIQKYKDGKKTR